MGAERRQQWKWALSDITVSFEEGWTVGLVGHNGAGKSTLCLMLAQIMPPDRGTIRIRGRVSALASFGAGFYHDLSGRENALTYGAYLGIPRSVMATKMDGIIDFSELGRDIDEPIRTYSSGMRARLGFSVATSIEPDILLLDEVFAVGDAGFRAKSRQRIETLMQSSRLLVMASHSPQLIRRLCSHCLWLHRGTVRRFGPTAEVLDAYLDASAPGARDPLTDAVND